MPETARPRGRPRATPEDIACNRARIAAVARRLFQAEGYAAVSMRRLAQEAGCTPMTLYSYFDSKADILHLLWDEILSGLFAALEARAAAEPDPVARLEAVAQGYLAYWLARRDHYFMVFMSGGLSRADVEGFVAPAQRQRGVLARFDLFTTCLADARTLRAPNSGPSPDGPSPPDSPPPDSATPDSGPPSARTRLKAELLVCALNGIAHNLITIPGVDWSPPEALVAEAVAGVLHAP